MCFHTIVTTRFLCPCVCCVCGSRDTSGYFSTIYIYSPWPPNDFEVRKMWMYWASIFESEKWKWRDIRSSMVTHTRKLCSAINPSKVHTHSSEHTHTPWTHTRSSGQPFMLRRPGSSWGFGALLKGTSVVVLRVERAIHSLPPPTIPAGDSNSQPLDYESDSLTIRPWLPPNVCIKAEACNFLQFFSQC